MKQTLCFGFASGGLARAAKLKVAGGRPGVGGRLRMGTVADDLAFLGAAWR